jgi:hypothetical protein
MKTKHTKGEWFVSICTPKIGAKHPCVMTKQGNRSRMVVSCSDGTDEEIKANALLISKSPKLLDKAKTIYR